MPEALGGTEVDTISIVIAMEELGRACGSTALSLAAHNGLGCAPIKRWGTPAQHEQWFPG
ncbi:acyl-CoA dehydrogenase family protein [Candidatus Flexifilum breve]|uniref:acyl-CoA dehydrogenase family protein n=1 Tax=Candidatus Flexifilum breve TaxID=3140694 RepID=UPI0031CC9697